MSFDLPSILLPDTPPLEIILRGTVMYLSLFFLLRLTLKRQAGALGVTDLLVVVLIADAAQNAMAGDYDSISDGLILVGTIVFWAYALDWLGYRFHTIERLIHPRPLPLIENGRILPRNLRRELITHEELMTRLRSQGVEDIADVERAYMEGTGELTVLRRGETRGRGQDRLAT